MSEQRNPVGGLDPTLLAPSPIQQPIEQVRVNAERQAETVQVRPVDVNEDGERYALVGGNVSQLPEKAWKVARTSAFKEWFGDWEHVPVQKFKTAQGSVYTYDEFGRTTRFKTVTGKEDCTQDVTVFAALSQDEIADFLTVIYGDERITQLDGKKYSARLGEKLPDGRGKVINTRADITNPEELALVILTGQNPDGTFTAQNIEHVKRASLQPAYDLTPFDTRKFQVESGEWYRELHLGNKVTDIMYAASDVSKMLVMGEPKLFDDPRNPGAKCFIKSTNPYVIGTLWFMGWVSQFGTHEGRREAMMTSLKQSGYDGVLVDGKPVIENVSGKMLFEDNQILSVAV